MILNIGVHRNIFAVQGHPEFNYDYAVKERIWPSVVTLNKRMNEKEQEMSLKTFENFNHSDHELLNDIIRQFLSKSCNSCEYCSEL